MNKCRLLDADLDAIERLMQRVLLRHSADTIPRSVLLRALLRRGLDLAKTREVTGDFLPYSEVAIPVSFVLPANERARLNRLLAHIEMQRPNSFATLTNIQRPVLLMALAEVETQASFPAFCQEVLRSLPPPSTHQAVSGFVHEACPRPTKP